jgi:hypothetical protein
VCFQFLLLLTDTHQVDSQRKDSSKFGPFLLFNYRITGEESDVALWLKPVQTLQELLSWVASILMVGFLSKIVLFVGHNNGESQKIDFARLPSTDRLLSRYNENRPILLRYAPAGYKTPPSITPPQSHKELSP